MSKPLYIYNLYPRLYKNATVWQKSLDAIVDMGFNSVFINAFHATGASGSVYSIKDYFSFDPILFSRMENAAQELQYFVSECRQHNLDIFVDLVANHVAIDSPLVQKHPDWFFFDIKGRVISPQTWNGQEWIVWKDLAKFNLANSPDRDRLWQFMLEVCQHYLKLGFTGFRCDAAYHVASEFWTFLLNRLKADFPGTVFLAETFMAQSEDIKVLALCGFDYIFNSAKWWNFSDTWCLEQQEFTRQIIPSISFPETHDTQRLMAEVKGDLPAFLQRLYFTGFFSKGFMVVNGLEFGFTKQLDCVTTRSNDWENTGQDFSAKLKQLLIIKKSLRALHEESQIEVIRQDNQNILCLLKTWEQDKVLIVLNKDNKHKQHVFLSEIENVLQTSNVLDLSPEKRYPGYILLVNGWLSPGEVRLFAGEDHVISRTH